MHSKIKQNIKPTLPRYDTDYIYALLKDMDITVQNSARARSRTTNNQLRRLENTYMYNLADARLIIKFLARNKNFVF